MISEGEDGVANQQAPSQQGFKSQSLNQVQLNKAVVVQKMKKEIERLLQRNDLLTKVVGEYKSSDRKEKQEEEKEKMK